MSSTASKNTRTALTNLVQILHDGQEGFRKASEGVKDPQLKELFSRFSLQRAQFAGELDTQLLSLGAEDPHKEGTTVAGKAHRVWIDLKAALTGNDAHAVLAEAERGEDAAVKAYDDALSEADLPAPIHEVISKQAACVLRAHDEVKALRDAAKTK
jgi:uncharacterized protein (TIGR02284 family)